MSSKSQIRIGSILLILAILTIVLTNSYVSKELNSDYYRKDFFSHMSYLHQVKDTVKWVGGLTSGVGLVMILAGLMQKSKNKSKENEIT